MIRFMFPKKYNEFKKYKDKYEESKREEVRLWKVIHEQSDKIEKMRKELNKR